MVLQNPDWMPYYAAMATLGSIAGCYAIYYLAEKGGEAFIRRRLKPGHVERALALYKRHGLLALMVPALLPPPAPRSEEHTSELQSQSNLVCRLLLEKKKAS